MAKKLKKSNEKADQRLEAARHYYSVRKLIGKLEESKDAAESLLNHPVTLDEFNRINAAFNRLRITIDRFNGKK